LQFTILVPTKDEAGLYSLYFHNCAKDKEKKFIPLAIESLQVGWSASGEFIELFSTSEVAQSLTPLSLQP